MEARLLEAGPGAASLHLQVTRTLGKNLIRAIRPIILVLIREFVILLREGFINGFVNKLQVCFF